MGFALDGLSETKEKRSQNLPYKYGFIPQSLLIYILQLVDTVKKSRENSGPKTKVWDTFESNVEFYQTSMRSDIDCVLST